MGAKHNYQANKDWPPVIQEVMEVAYGEAIKRFDDTLSQVEPILLDMARAEEEDAEKDRIITATEAFIYAREAMDTAFTDKWIDICDRLKPKSVGGDDKQSAAADKLDLSHLSILGEDELQDKIALQNLSSATGQEFRYLLVPIRSGMEQAMPDRVVNRSSIAFFPTSQAECIFEGLQAFESTKDIRHAILNLFRYQYFTNIESFYQSIGKIFEDNGFQLTQMTAVSHASSPSAGASQAPPGAAQAAQAATSDYAGGAGQAGSPGYTGAIGQAGTMGPSGAAGYSGATPQMTVAGGPAPTGAGPAGASPSDDLAQELGHLLQNTQLPAHMPSAPGSSIATPSYTSLSAVPADLGADMSIVTVSNKEVDGMLAKMQDNAAASDFSEETPDIHKTFAHLLKSKASPNSHRVMSQMGENVINLVSLLFEFILHNDNISPLVSNLLMRLQIPYMRMAVSDQTLFSNRDHSARKLLNKLAELAAGVSNAESLEYKKIHEIVDELSQRFKGDPAHIDKLTADISDFAQARATESEAEETVIQQQAATEEELTLAGKIAGKLVNEKIEKIDNSLIFHSLLEKVWIEVLKHRFIESGHETEQWQDSVNLLDGIIGSTRAGNDPDEKKQLLRSLPKLVPKIKDTFKECKIDELIHSHFLDQLHEIHISIIKGKAGDEIVDNELEHSSAVKLIIDDIDEEEQAKEEEELAQKVELAVGHDFGGDESHSAPVIDEDTRLDTQTVLEIINGLRPGIWMEYMVKGEPVRCKIALYAPHQEKYIFVEGSGRKLFDRIRAELIADVQDKLAKVVESGDMFEVAMRSVVTNIRAQRQVG